MWLLRSGGAHASGRASDLQSQPMSGIEEEEREHELYHTETFPVAGVSRAQSSGSPIRARSPAPPEYVNIDESLREDVRKQLLAYQRPVLNMMRQIAGVANMEYHRIVKQEVTEEAVDYVFKFVKEQEEKQEAHKRAEQWFKDACKANTIYEPTKQVADQFQVGVYLRIIKKKSEYILYVGIPNRKFERKNIENNNDFLQMAADVYTFLVQENVFAAEMQPNESHVSMLQAVELSKFNLSELRDIVENYGTQFLQTQLIDPKVEDGSDDKGAFMFDQFDAGTKFAFAGVQNQRVKNYIKAFIHTGEQITEIEARMDAHISEASQLVYDVLSSRGGEDDIGDANTVREWMLSPDSQSTINGARVLFARIVANRFCLSNDLAPKQGYLQARYGRLRQQAAILLVNLRRLHYKDKQFTLDTTIPRRSYSIY